MAKGVAPQTPLDILLVAIWSEILGRRVGIQDSLAELGATEPEIERSRGARAVAERLGANVERAAAYQRALLAYVPGSYGGPVVLLWPERERRRHRRDLTQ